MQGRMLVMLVAAVGAAVLLGGCASRRATQDRMRVVEAEAINSRQRAMEAERSLKTAELKYDQVNAEQQAAQAQLLSKQRQVETLSMQVGKGEQYKLALTQAQQDTQRQLSNLRQLDSQVNNMTGMMDALRREAAEARAKAEEEKRDYFTNEHVEAFRRDLEARLRANKVNLPVETRTTQTGERQVAVVLRGAFPSGKHSIAHNMDAVKAVVWLGELIAEEYPGSRIRVEGHTDSDPIRSSNYSSNQELSLKRAGSVQELLAKAGVSEGSIEVVGHGPGFPLERGTTDRAKKVNRRVEIYILPRQ